MLSRIATSVLAACLLVLAGLTMFQNNLLYFPDRAPLAEMTGGGLTPWPSAGDFRGLLAEPAVPARATVIVFHGNAGHAAHRRYYSELLNGLALRVILAEYPGYGPRGGDLGESSLVADAERTIADARRTFSGPLLIIGESLGAGVAAAASARQAAAVSGMLLFTPWDRLENIARHHYPLLPVKWILRDQYDSKAHLASFGRPILVAVAEDDAIVPSRFGQALFAALGEPRRLVVIRGAGHNDWFDRLDRQWWSEAIEFLLSAGP